MNTDTPETFKSAMWSELGWSVDIDFARRLERERDEWKAKYIQQNKDLGCELRDPNGTIWDHAKTLQRERDEARAESISWQSIAEGRGRTDDEEENDTQSELAAWELLKEAENKLAIAESQLASYKARYIKLAGKYAIETHEITAQRDKLAEALNMYAWPCSDQELSHFCCSASPSFSVKAQQEMKRRNTLQSLTPNAEP